MPLLESLPEEVENSLKDLRSSAVRLSERNGDSDSKVITITTDVENGRLCSENVSDEVKILQTVGFETDITQEGIFGREWAVADSDNVYVFSPNGGSKAKLHYSVPLQRIKEAKAEQHVGNGILEVRTD